MVEDCRCPEGYTGLSCQRCADGYLRVSDGRGGVGRCVRCNCNGHATSCDPESGRCLVRNTKRTKHCNILRLVSGKKSLKGLTYR